MSNPTFPLDPEIVAAEIGIPLDRWPGNCHGIAEAILHRMPTEGMRLVRGHFTGWVSKDSVYSRAGMQQHSWLRLQDGRILDPTRWAMTSPDRPHIYLGENDEYDEGGIGQAQRMRPGIFMAGFLSGNAHAPEAAIAAMIGKASPTSRFDLAEAAELPGLAKGEVSLLDAGRLRSLLADPVEHLQDGPALYGAAQAAGLKSLIKIDNWIRVMEPDRVSPPFGTNFFYADPPSPDLSEMQKLFLVFAKFLSIEEREMTIEDELEEIGYKLDELHDAINAMEKCLKYDPDLEWMPRGSRDLLCVVAGDLLGRGFGQEIRVERFADSVGLTRNALHRALVAFAEPAGYSLQWLCGHEAGRAMEEVESARIPSMSF